MAATLGARFAERKTNGFDYLRVILALGIVAWHCVTISFGPHRGDQMALATFWVLVVRSIMPIFFALSGFLVASSLERSNGLQPFLVARVLRIFPALTVEVVLCALVLGPILTVDTLHDYFTGRHFFSYFLNVIGSVHFLLPGVFVQHPDFFVNRSLWTVPSELECYILLSALYAAGAFRSRLALTALTLVYVIVATLSINVSHYSSQVVVWSRLLPLAFMAGVLVWKWRDRLPAGVIWGVAALGLMIALMVDIRFSPLACFPAAYVAAAFGCLDVPRHRLLASGDYSYGIYLYGYPIQQVIVAAIGPGRPWATLIAAFVLVPIFAAFSWHAVEKHVLRLKSRLVGAPRVAAIPDHEPQRSGASSKLDAPTA